MVFQKFILLLVLTLFVGRGMALHSGLEFLDDPAPGSAFELPDLGGEIHRLDDYRGNYLIISFWATWCGPCVREMPALQRAFQALRHDRIQVLAINVGETRKRVQRFDEAFDYQFPLLLDEGMSVSTAWQVAVMPTSFIVDPKGAVVARVIGVFHWDAPEFVEKLKRMNARYAHLK